MTFTAGSWLYKAESSGRPTRPPDVPGCGDVTLSLKREHLPGFALGDAKLGANRRQGWPRGKAIPDQSHQPLQVNRITEFERNAGGQDGGGRGVQGCTAGS